MEHRSLSVAACLIALAAFSAPSSAAEDGPSAEQQADWEARLAKAAALQADGKARQVEAERRHDEQDLACYKKFLVNSCRDDARKAYRAASRAGKNQENEGKAIELQVRKEQLSDKDARRAAAVPERETQLREREAETAAARQAAAAKEATTLSEKERKAEEGSRRKAADAERLRKKQAEHEARLAEKKQKAERRAAETAAKP